MTKNDTLNRKCIVTQEILPVGNMVRFVISPDGVITPDLKNVLPGRGIWVTAQKQTLQKAVDKNSFARSAKQSVVIPDGLCDTLESLLEKRVVNSVSIARRAGFAITGFEKVRELLKSEMCHIVISTADSMADSSKKLAGMCRMLDVFFTENIDEDTLASVFGREFVKYVGIAESELGESVKKNIQRLNVYRNGE